MPYITPDDRERLNYQHLRWVMPHTPGELNYVFSRIIANYMMAAQAKNAGMKSYSHINDVLGALEGAKQEFYRVVAAPYEDEKMRANGEVYRDAGQ